MTTFKTRLWKWVAKEERMVMNSRPGFWRGFPYKNGSHLGWGRTWVEGTVTGVWVMEIVRLWANLVDVGHRGFPSRAPWERSNIQQTGNAGLSGASDWIEYEDSGEKPWAQESWEGSSLGLGGAPGTRGLGDGFCLWKGWWSRLEALFMRSLDCNISPYFIPFLSADSSRGGKEYWNIRKTDAITMLLNHIFWTLLHGFNFRVP